MAAFCTVTWHGCDADFEVFRAGLLLPALEAGGPASPGRCGNLATSWGACDLVGALLGRRSCGRDKHTPSSLVEGVLSLTSHWVTRLGSSADSLGAGKTGNKNKPLAGGKTWDPLWLEILPFPTMPLAAVPGNPRASPQPQPTPQGAGHPSRRLPVSETSGAATQMCEQGGKAGGRGQLPLGNRAPSCRCHH